MANEELGDLAPLAAELAEALAPTIQLGGLIGRGGMGAVFLARDPALKRSVVVKVLSPELAHDETLRRRFAREAESAAAVAHPNVVAVHAVGELPRSKTSYFVMQYVDGVTLGDACPEGVKVPAARVARIVGEVASALAAAHARGLVHRDIKPPNIMLEKGTERAIVLDFGISAALTGTGDGGPGTDIRLTQKGMSLGTPQYMSPEQAAGEDVTGASDIYSLGVVAFELLAGRAPFEATNPMALAAAHIKDTPPDLMRLRPDIDPSVAGLVARMLAKPAGDRPSADEVSRALLPSSHALIEWPPPGLERLRGEMAKAMRWMVAGMIAMLAFFGVIGVQPVVDPTAFLVMTAAVGIIAIFICLGAALAVGIAGTRIGWARQSGYPWWTAFDVSLDVAPDTGEIVNASGRYAFLKGGRGDAGTGERGDGEALLRSRRWAALALGVGSSLSAGLVFAWAEGLVGWDTGSMAPVAAREVVVIMAPAALALVVNLLLTARERRLRRRLYPEDRQLFQRWRRNPPVPPELVAGWLQNAGATAPPVRSRWQILLIRNAFEIPASLPPLLLELAVLIIIVGGIFLPRPVRGTRDRRLWEDSVAARSARVGGFRGLDAVIGRAAGVRDASPPDTAAARELIAGEHRDPSPGGTGAAWRAFEILPGRLSAPLHDSLAAMAGAGGDVFARVAASGPLSATWYGDDSLAGIDSDRGARTALAAVTRVAGRRAAAAALALASGDRAGAEREGRRIMAVGRQLWRDPRAVAAATGLGIVDLGIRVLRNTALATGNGALGREADSLAALVQVRRQQAALFSVHRFARYYASPTDTAILRLAGNADYAPSDRWQAVAAISFGPCWNPVEVRRGVSPRRRALLAEAGRRAHDIARTDEWVAGLNRELDRFDAVEYLGRSGTIGWLKPALRATACGTH